MIRVLFIPLYFTHAPTHLPYGSHQLVLCIEESDFFVSFFPVIYIFKFHMSEIHLFLCFT